MCLNVHMWFFSLVIWIFKKHEMDLSANYKAHNRKLNFKYE